MKDPTSRLAYDTCALQAAHGGCQSYDMAAACRYAEPDVGPTAGCLIQTFHEFYDAVVPLFCGAPPNTLEGGIQPSFDASPDVISHASPDATVDARADASGDARTDAATVAPTDGSTDAPAADAAKE